MATPAPATFAKLLEQAVNEPGILSNAYRQFHNYSLGNQLLAWAQCVQRGIEPGPIATFQRWKELGRYVRKGEKAITVRVQQRLARLRINEKCTLETNTLDERGLSSRRRQNERSGQKERGHQTGRGKR